MASLKRKAGAELAAAVDPKKSKQQQQSSLMSFFAAPKPAANGANGGVNGAPGSGKPVADYEPAGPKFDKARWVAKLTPEQKRLLQLEIDTLGDSWLAVLKDDLTSTSFLDLKRFLQREKDAGRTIFPPPADIYSWSRYTPLHNVKVVIVGQDPYHNHGQAHGLAFSVKPPVPPPPSLRNMYIALRNDYPDGFAPPPASTGGLLTPWAERGVLMLNTCLTVRAHDANSHANHGWERFTQRVLDVVAQRRTRGVVFMAWGSPAAKRVAKIDGQRHLVLRSVHPSPLSAHRGFFDCGHFRQANMWLMQRYGADGEVDWSLLPGTTTKAKPVESAKKEDPVEKEGPLKAEKKEEVTAEKAEKAEKADKVDKIEPAEKAGDTKVNPKSETDKTDKTGKADKTGEEEKENVDVAAQDKLTEKTSETKVDAQLGEVVA